MLRFGIASSCSSVSQTPSLSQQHGLFELHSAEIATVLISLRWLYAGGSNQRLITTQPRAPAHFPEIGLEPGRFLEDRDQLGFARGCDIEMGEPV